MKQNKRTIESMKVGDRGVAVMILVALYHRNLLYSV